VRRALSKGRVHCSSCRWFLKTFNLAHTDEGRMYIYIREKNIQHVLLPLTYCIFILYFHHELLITAPICPRLTLVTCAEYKQVECRKMLTLQALNQQCSSRNRVKNILTKVKNKSKVTRLYTGGTGTKSMCGSTG
jgi:hypothetical protein